MDKEELAELFTEALARRCGDRVPTIEDSCAVTVAFFHGFGTDKRMNFTAEQRAQLDAVLGDLLATFRNTPTSNEGGDINESEEEDK